ncbi:hypothetical protein [Streptomyces purpurascens]|uniref:Uncharacterized protein n=1 Tax=Streptomyces purpurascens TaxID=1924 RepID=A0ABZ1MHN2_STREF|nr:hypothetical protein [Streptomyces purpurascens]MCE7044904.1 hypothetical protein [Streptomyces purpurascens]GHA14241.1 hypothetical protein GCM10010303_25550 [Streptomyces purpurascens]
MSVPMAHDDVTLAYKGMGLLPDWAAIAIAVLVCVWLVVVLVRRKRS